MTRKKSQPPPPQTIPVAKHRDYTLLWDLADQMAKQAAKSDEACWLELMDAFWRGELPALFAFVPRLAERKLMKLPSRDVLARHFLGRVKPIERFAKLQGWTLRNCQSDEIFGEYVARDPAARFGLTLQRADFDQWAKQGKASPSPGKASPSPGKASPSPPLRNRPNLALATRALSAIYGSDIPSQEEEPNKLLCKNAGKWLMDNKLRKVSDSTILRAAGRRK
jgi:hypothetical protein